MKKTFYFILILSFLGTPLSCGPKKPEIPPGYVIGEGWASQYPDKASCIEIASQKAYGDLAKKLKTNVENLDYLIAFSKKVVDTAIHTSRGKTQSFRDISNFLKEQSSRMIRSYSGVSMGQTETLYKEVTEKDNLYDCHVIIGLKRIFLGDIEYSEPTLDIRDYALRISYYLNKLSKEPSEIEFKAAKDEPLWISGPVPREITYKGKVYVVAPGIAEAASAERALAIAIARAQAFLIESISVKVWGKEALTTIRKVLKQKTTTVSGEKYGKYQKNKAAYKTKKTYQSTKLSRSQIFSTFGAILNNRTIIKHETIKKSADKYQAYVLVGIPKEDYERLKQVLLRYK